jgi:hypothetical protein
MLLIDKVTKQGCPTLEGIYARTDQCSDAAGNHSPSLRASLAGLSMNRNGKRLVIDWSSAAWIYFAGNERGLIFSAACGRFPGMRARNPIATSLLMPGG